MRIIICGAGQVGFNIAQQLSRENHEIALIDSDPALINKINDSMDVKAIGGHASAPSVLEQAGAEDADMLVAVTYSDEVNIVACEVSHALFNIPMKIARLRRQDYLHPKWQAMYRQENLSIDVVISPEREASDAILRRLHAPGTRDMMPLFDDKLHVLAIRCERGARLSNLPLSLVQQKAGNLAFAMVGLIRDGTFMPPKQDIILSAGDIVYLACEKTIERQVIALFGHQESYARNLLILGGGNIGLHVALALEDEHQTRATLIEFSRTRAEFISDRLPSTTIIHGSGLEREILEEAGVQNTDTIISVTNDDKVNILASLMAKRAGCKHCISLINNNAYVPLLGNLEVDVTINPRETTISSILHHVRRGRVRAVYSIHDSAAEIMEADAMASASIVGKTIEQLDLPHSIRIVALMRKDSIIYPDATTTIQEHDRVVVLCMSDMIKRAEKLFSVGYEFF